MSDIILTKKFQVQLINPMADITQIREAIQDHSYLKQFGAVVELDFVESPDKCELTIVVAEEGSGGPFGSAVRAFVENELGLWFKGNDVSDE